ncbi:unnamed protein product [Zymoseptoria tritici ST99CH_1A5]|uniref:F-box domain-containing protein n=1 Tax=Zymoseptoria tritici ST99CH_1A5 TaxID=1276529 RepID=A0A1Y6M0E5_ZYMTR|nr:unnamed protein product [Zymoseptoria tritici ST99CH_1A5]
MDSPSRASTPHLDTTTTTMTDSFSDQNDGAAKRADSPLSSSDEAVETKIAALPTLSAKEQPIMPLADSPSVPTDGVLEGEMVVEQSPFMRIPAELRVRIYKLLVLSHPTKRIECPSETCTDGSSFLASTCKPVNSQVRSYKCRVCARFRGHDVHLEILRTSRQVYHEASAVLYENVEIVARGFGSGGFIAPPSTLALHVRQLCCILPDVRGHYRHFRDMPTRNWFGRTVSGLPNLPNLQLVRLHQDVNWTSPTSRNYDTILNSLDVFTLFGPQVEFALDIHITRAWSDEGTSMGWMEEIVSRTGHEERAKELDAAAVRLRQRLVDGLGEAFKRKGKVLKIRGEGSVEAEVAEDEQEG